MLQLEYELDREQTNALPLTACTVLVGRVATSQQTQGALSLLSERPSFTIRRRSEYLLLPLLFILEGLLVAAAVVHIPQGVCCFRGGGGNNGKHSAPLAAVPRAFIVVSSHLVAIFLTKGIKRILRPLLLLLLSDA